MHALHEHLCQQLDKRLGERSIVVVYDPGEEFRPFFERELAEVGKGFGNLPRVLVGERLTFLARYQGSFFGLRALVEPIAALERPEPLVIYVPGVTRDRRGSILLELELGGTTYEPQLKRLSRALLLQRYTDGQIDELLKPQNVGYEDVVSFLQQAEEGGTASALRGIFGGRQSEDLIAAWLAEPERDRAIQEKEALPELLKLIEARLGFKLPEDVAAAEAREKTLRYVLVAEFRSDLSCEPPLSVSRLPSPASKEHTERSRDVAARLRRDSPEKYAPIADRVEAELGLADSKIDAAALGRIDTFRFEERCLLHHAGELLARGMHGPALEIVTGRNRSFWVDRDVARQAQWEACRLMGELVREIERVSPQVARAGTNAAVWLESYTAPDGWHRVDTLHRRLTAWVAGMAEDPEAQEAYGRVERSYDDLLQKQCAGFSRALQSAGWTVPGALLQTHVFPEVVRPLGDRVAYFLVDSLRFEMAVELAQKLLNAKEVALRPAVAAVPTITPVGMAALLPGASGSFSVKEHRGQIAAWIDGTPLPSLSDRKRFFQARVPGVIDMTLSGALKLTPSKLPKASGGMPLVVVRSQEIDAVGEADEDLAARQAMGSILDNLVRAMKRLAKCGIQSFAVAADHGHLYSLRKEEDMRIDDPGGRTLDSHRRVWIGRGGATPPATVRIGGAELGYDSDLDFVFPTGLGVFKAGGGLTYHHGGLSLQELIVPVLTFRMPVAEGSAARSRTVRLVGLPDVINNRTFGIRLLTEGNMLETESRALRVLLVEEGELVGRVGMAVEAELDRESGILHVAPSREASVGLMLTRDNCRAVRIVVQDAVTDAVLDQSEPIPVRLAI